MRSFDPSLRLLAGQWVFAWLYVPREPGPGIISQPLPLLPPGVGPAMPPPPAPADKRQRSSSSEVGAQLLHFFAFTFNCVVVVCLHDRKMSRRRTTRMLRVITGKVPGLHVSLSGAATAYSNRCIFTPKLIWFLLLVLHLR